MAAQRADSSGLRDSLRFTLAPLVVTATRAPRALTLVPVPTTVVTAAQIAAQKPLRLSDLLAEQPGLFVGEGFGGAGLQVQGFDPDYTLVLIDGEPVVGRTGGTLDLERIAVAGVERVEIVRGPTSSRYGSDALAGVVNVITRRPGTRTAGEVSARAQTHGTRDLTLQGETGTDRRGARLFVNRYTSNGYDFQPEAPGQTAPRFEDLSGEVRLRAWIGETDLGLRLRGARQRQSNAFALTDGVYDEQGRRDEWTVTPTLRRQLSGRLMLNASLHAARFLTATRAAAQATGTVFDATDFDERYGKAEASLTYVRSARLALYAGGGAQRDAVGGDRYAAERTAWQGFGFAEAEYTPWRWLSVNSSARFDRHEDFAARWSPKVAVLVRPYDRLRLRASVGSGFKAPAFRQLYLTFSNGPVGYSVFGTDEVRVRLAELQAAGGIAEVLLDPATLGTLRAESSVAYSVGGEVDLGARWTAKAHLFHNEVRDLIDTQAIARKTNGQSVFTYFNLARIYTRGVEAELAWRAGRGLGLTASYQGLDTADRDVLDAIAAGTLYGRDAQNRDYRVRRASYGGLLGRSRHSGTVRLDATPEGLPWSGSLRLIWRSRYGDRDANANLVLDDTREYVPGYATLAATLSRTLGHATVTAGARNLFNYTHPARVPDLPGRLLFLGASVHF